jgi:hypothetical protein
MNCPKCKNPIQEDSVECEWCGNKIILDFIPVNPIIIKKSNQFNNKSLKFIVYLILLMLSIILTMNNDDIPFHFIVLGGIVFYEIFNYFKNNN